MSKFRSRKSAPKNTLALDSSSEGVEMTDPPADTSESEDVSIDMYLSDIAKRSWRYD